MPVIKSPPPYDLVNMTKGSRFNSINTAEGMTRKQSNQKVKFTDDISLRNSDHFNFKFQQRTTDGSEISKDHFIKH